MAPLFHRYVSAPVPPVTVKLIVPVDDPWHSTFVDDPILALKAVGSVIVWLVVIVQPVASVTVIV